MDKIVSDDTKEADEKDASTTEGARRPRKRRRRTAEEARREILEAARRRLLDGGPDNVRLQLIGRDVGLSHSSILHHFGSRDGLMEALREEAFQALAKDLAERLTRPGGPFPSADFFERVSQTLGDEGYARLLAWQLMAGHAPEPGSVGRSVLGPQGSGGLMRGLAEPFHQRRCDWAARHGLPEPDEEDSRWMAAYIACALLGEALAGHLLIRSAGFDPTPEVRRRLRARFADHALATAFPVPGANPSDPWRAETEASAAETPTGAASAESGVHPMEPAERSADETG